MKSLKPGRVSQRITATLDEQLKEAARNLKIRRSELVRTALESYLEGLKVKTPAA